MSEDLENEIEAIRAIYDESTIRPTSDPTIYVFAVPQHDVSVRLHFPGTYPADPPRVQGVESTGPNTAKGYGFHVLGLVDQVLESVFEPGNVCLFDVVQELEARLSSSRIRREDGSAAATTIASRDDSDDDDDDDEGLATAAGPTSPTTAAAASATLSPPPAPREPSDWAPRWFISPALTEKKSTFLARAAAVHAPANVPRALAHLRATDKKTARATHVMTAYRIRDPRDGRAAITHEDCDDDGEAAAGARLLQLLQRMEVVDVLVVVSRWYGGVKLGNDRFRCINRVAREAVLVKLRGEE